MKYRNIAKLFTRMELGKLSQGNFETINSIAGKFPELRESRQLIDFYSKAYDILLRNYRNEYVVKNELANKILLGRHSMNTTTMASELRTGINIADCVVINKESACYEIKTEFDSLVRFQNQLNSYLQTFEKTFVVTHKSHMEHVLSIQSVTPKFGVIEMTDRNQFRTVRDAPVSQHFNLEMSFETLRKPEYVYIAELVSGVIPEMPNTQTYQYCKDIYTKLNPKEARALFNHCIKNFRKNDHTFINNLPKPLKNIGISYQFSRHEKNRIIYFLKEKGLFHQGETNVLPISKREASRIICA
jgi:hypothetical protein